MKVLGLVLLVLVILISFSIGSGSNEAAEIAVFVLYPAVIVLYFYPTVCATTRHTHFNLIFALNLVAGWTFIGWVVAFIWALYKSDSRKHGQTELISMALPVSRAESSHTRDCPYCAETIKAAAVKCRYCGSDVGPMQPLT